MQEINGRHEFESSDVIRLFQNLDIEGTQAMIKLLYIMQQATTAERVNLLEVLKAEIEK